MSKEKVDKYREDKLRRKEILAQEKKKKKQEKAIRTFVISLVALVIVGAIGWTIVNSVKNYQASKPNYDRDGLVVSDMTGVLLDDEPVEEPSTASEE